MDGKYRATNGQNLVGGIIRKNGDGKEDIRCFISREKRWELRLRVRSCRGVGELWLWSFPGQPSKKLGRIFRGISGDKIVQEILRKHTT